MSQKTQQVAYVACVLALGGSLIFAIWHGGQPK